MAKKTYHYYYYDEANDDFANNGIETKVTPEDYDYYPREWWLKLLTPISYYFFLFIFTIVYWTSTGVKIRNRKVLKERKDRKKGYYVYANHTSWIKDAVTQPVLSFPKKVYTICNSDAISIKGCGGLIHTFGATPLPYYRKTYKTYLEALEKMYEDGNPVVIFPEAHIWPKYNRIRNFPAGSFLFPVIHNAPSYARTLVYTKNEKGHTRGTIYYDGPFYPNPDLPRKEAELDLRNRIYDAMRKRAENSELDVDYTYTKVNTPEEVRTEIIEKN